MQNNYFDIDDTESPLAESNVSLQLAAIQLKCSELLKDDSSLELTLEEPVLRNDSFNPYDQG